MRVSTGCWLAIAVASVAGCLQQTESYPLLTPPPPFDGGDGTGSSSSGGPTDAGATDACSLSATVCSPVVDAGPDASCPPTGTVTGSLVSEAGACDADLVSVGGAVTASGCCSSVCLPAGCKP